MSVLPTETHVREITKDLEYINFNIKILEKHGNDTTVQNRINAIIQRLRDSNDLFPEDIKELNKLQERFHTTIHENNDNCCQSCCCGAVAVVLLITIGIFVIS